MDDLDDESLGIFYQRFEDYKKKIKEFLLDFDIVLLILCISILEEIATATTKDTIEDVTDVKVIGAPTNDHHSTTFEVAIVAEGLEASMDA